MLTYTLSLLSLSCRSSIEPSQQLNAEVIQTTDTASDTQADSELDSQQGTGHSVETGMDSTPDTDDSGDSDTGTILLPGDWLSVSAGADFACGIHLDGSLECWGDNSYGQSSPPSGIFMNFACAGYSACAIKYNSEIICWGHTNFWSDIPIIDNEELIFLRGGTSNFIAIDGGSELSWWGGDDLYHQSPPEGSFLSADIAIGPDDGCVVDMNGQVQCWTEEGAPYEPVAGVYVSVHLGSAFGCALDAAGVPTCWSDNDWATSVGADNPIPETYISMDLAATHGCGVTTAGVARCWGYPYEWWGSDSTDPPTGGFLDVAVGSLFSCGVTDNHDMVCWGLGSDGQTTPP